MMRVQIVLTCVVLVLAVHGAEVTSPTEDTDHVVGEIGTRLTDFARRAEHVGFHGAVLAARDGQVVAALGVGPADSNGDMTNTPNTLFEIASVTKQFTAAVVMQLVQAGKLNLDDSIAKHLPDVPADCHSITVEHLLRHTSGIPGSNSQGGGDDLDAVLPVFLRGGPRHKPGTNWEYWNQGYALLSEIVSVVSGRPYTEFCREALFAPAGMKHTCFTGDDAPDSAVVAVGRSAFGPPRSALEHPYGSYGFQYRGMGGVVTSVWDLWRWDRALHGNDILNDAAKVEMFSPGLNEYAFGWFVRTDTIGRVVQSHGGGVRGFVCEVRRYPNDDALLVVLSNRDDAPLRELVPALETILFGGDPAQDQPLAMLEQETAERLMGTYRDERGNQLVIGPGLILTAAQLRWSPPSGPVTRAVLGLDDEGTLAMYDGADTINLTVERDESGSVAALTILGLRFARDD